MSSRRGNPSSLWRSVVLQRMESKANNNSGGRRPQLSAETDDLPRTVHVDWVHATRPVVCAVDEMTGIWLVDMSIRGEKGAASSTSQSQGHTQHQHPQQHLQHPQLGEIYFRAVRNAGGMRKATAACTVQAQHAGFVLLGNDIHTAIVDSSRKVLVHTGGGGSSSGSSNKNAQSSSNSAVAAFVSKLPIGCLVTSQGAVLTFSTSGMLSSVRWSCTNDDESTVIDTIVMANNVVPHFFAVDNATATHSMGGDASLSSSSSASASSPFCFCIGWCSYRNILYVCLAQKSAATGSIESGAVLEIAGSSWSPFFSDITGGMCSSCETPFSSGAGGVGSRQRIGWVPRQRQIHALTLDFTKHTTAGNNNISAVNGGSAANASNYADFSLAVDGPVGMNQAMTPLATSAPAGGAASYSVAAETHLAYEAPFLLFKAPMRCVKQLGPFAVDLDSESSRQLFNRSNSSSGRQSSSSNYISSHNIVNAVLGVPHTKLENAVICTRGATASILMRRDKGIRASSSSAESNTNKNASPFPLKKKMNNNLKAKDVAAVDAWFAAHSSSNKKKRSRSGERKRHQPIPESDEDDDDDDADDDGDGDDYARGSCSASGRHHAASGADSDEHEELELVSQVEVPGGDGYIKTMGVSPSGIVLGFGFENGAIVVAFCGASFSEKTQLLGQKEEDESSSAKKGEPGSAARPGVSFVSSSRGHSVPQLLFVTRAMSRLSGVAPTSIVIDERRACMLVLDVTGTVEMLVFPSDLRNGTSSSGAPPFICSSVHRIAVAQKVGPMDAPLESALPPMKSACCVGAASIVCGSQQQQQQQHQDQHHHHHARLRQTADSRLQQLQQQKLAALVDITGTVSGSALQRCAQLEELEIKSMTLAKRLSTAPPTRQQLQEGSLNAQELRAFHSLHSRLQLGGMERRDTAAATTLDRHFFEGYFQPHFNPYTCVCLQDDAAAMSGGGSGERLLVNGAQLLSVVERAKAEAFAQSAPSLAPSTVAAKFRSIKAAVGRATKLHEREEQKRQRAKKALAAAATAAAAASCSAGVDNDPVLMMGRGSTSASGSSASALVPWSNGWSATRNSYKKPMYEQVPVDAESVHEAREMLALLRYLVPDEATQKYCSPFSIAP